MTSDDTVQLNRLVGGLEAKIDGFKDTWVEQDRRAAEGRRFLFDRVDGLSRDVQGLTHQVTSVVRDVADMKPAVTDWQCRQRPPALFPEPEMPRSHRRTSELYRASRFED